MTQTTFRPTRRVRRYHSEPYWSDNRGSQYKGNWRMAVPRRKPSPRRIAARKLYGNGSLNLHNNKGTGQSHIWYKAGINHPCFANYHDYSHGQHMPKFLRKRIMKQLQLEDRKKKPEEGKVKHPCFHCGLPWQPYTKIHEEAVAKETDGNEIRHKHKRQHLYEGRNNGCCRSSH